MIDFLLDGGRKRECNDSKLLLPESESELALARGRETVDASMMTIIIQHVKRWMMFDINV